jgi:hypothetical protein
MAPSIKTRAGYLRYNSKYQPTIIKRMEPSIPSTHYLITHVKTGTKSKISVNQKNKAAKFWGTTMAATAK